MQTFNDELAGAAAARPGAAVGCRHARDKARLDDKMFAYAQQIDEWRLSHSYQSNQPRTTDHIGTEEVNLTSTDDDDDDDAFYLFLQKQKIALMPYTPPQERERKRERESERERERAVSYTHLTLPTKA